MSLTPLGRIPFLPNPLSDLPHLAQLSSAKSISHWLSQGLTSSPFCSLWSAKQHPLHHIPLDVSTSGPLRLIWMDGIGISSYFISCLYFRWSLSKWVFSSIYCLFLILNLFIHTVYIFLILFPLRQNLAMEPIVASHLATSWLTLPGVGITGMDHHTQLLTFEETETEISWTILLFALITHGFLKSCCSLAFNHI